MGSHRPSILNFSLNHPWAIVAAVLVLTLTLGLQIPKIQIDTDPENMLSENEFVRIFHNEVKSVFNIIWSI